jgi:hypothetical protein
MLGDLVVSRVTFGYRAAPMGRPLSAPDTPPALGHDQFRCARCRLFGDAALSLVSAARGGAITHDDVLACAGLPPADFARHAGTVDHCLRVAYEGVLRRALDRFAADFAAAPTWEAGLYAGALAELRTVADTPGGPWLHYVGTSGTADSVLRCARATFREDVLDRMTAARDDGPDRIGAELLLGVVWSTVRAHVAGDGEVRDRDALESLLAQVVFEMVPTDG